MVRIAINGFGRIGRSAFKIALEKENVEVVAINDLTDARTLAHLLKYDTAYGRYEKEVSFSEKTIIVNGKEYPVLSQADPEQLPWKAMNVNVVLECTGRFVDGNSARSHVRAGAQYVVLSAPAKNSEEIPTVVLGVNDEDIHASDIISNASCTTNCIGCVTKIIHDTFGIEKAMMTTVHSYTADQNLQDGPHRDLRRARAAGQNIVPTTTGAAIAAAEVIPALKGNFDGLAIRVPTLVVSLSDMTFVVSKNTTKEEVNAVLSATSERLEYRSVLRVTSDPLVSSDLIRDPYSSIVDLSLTNVVGNTMVKVIAWYDNEWGYSNRLVELSEKIGSGV